MAATNAERVKAWRERQLADPDKAEAYRANRAEQARKRPTDGVTDGVTSDMDRAEIERLKQELEAVKDRARNYAEQSRIDLENAFNLAEQLVNLRKYNKGLNTRNQRLTLWLDYYNIVIGDDGEVETKAGLSAENWDRLRKMDDGQLRQWVMVGKAMAEKGHEDTIENSLAWVEGNRPALT